MQHEVRVRTSRGLRRFFIDDAFCQSLSVVERRNVQSVSLFIASWVTLLADSPLDPGNKPPHLFSRFLSRIQEDGVKATVTRFTNLAHEFVSLHSLMGTPSLIGEWIDGFKDTPVFFEYNRYYQTGDISIARFLYTFLNFGKKLEFVDESFNETAFRGWTDIETGLANLELSSVDTDSISAVLKTLLPRFSLEDFRPKFGPGAVQERGVRGRIGKLRSFQYDPLIDRFLFHGHIGKYGLGKESGLTPDRVIPDVSKWDPARGISSRVARLMFVPKNLKVARSICMEPSTLMYFQQGIMSRMTELIESSRFGSFIRLNDQSYNRDLSLIGSYTSEIDTIDLSSASDCLSLELVKKVFPQSWQIPMIVSRSHSAILPDGTLRPLLKFAPMGSALCFPTQCLLFASVCIYAACLYTYEAENVNVEFLDWMSSATIRRIARKFRRSRSLAVHGFQPLGIYGDDICVDRRLTDIVKAILSRLGFVVNDEKSFTGSQSFRESCGGFYLNGHDITPLYFRVKGVKEFTTPSHVASQVHLINSAWVRGYKNLYRFLRYSIMTWESRGRLRNKTSSFNPIPYVSDSLHFGILCKSPLNNHVEQRTHKDYQREEIRVWTISYDRKVSDAALLDSIDAYEYMRWWPGHTSDKPLEVNSSIPRYDTGSPGLRWRWIPV